MGQQLVVLPANLPPRLCVVFSAPASCFEPGLMTANLLAVHEGFEYYGSTTRAGGSGDRQSFKCDEEGCGVNLALEPSSSTEDPRATIVQASLAHNHPLVLEEDARDRHAARVRLCEEELRLRALEQLKKLKKGYDYQLVSAVTTSVYETFTMQTEILDDIGKILGHKAKEDLRKEAKEAGILCEADAVLSNEADSEVRGSLFSSTDEYADTPRSTLPASLVSARRAMHRKAVCGLASRSLTICDSTGTFCNPFRCMT